MIREPGRGPGWFRRFPIEDAIRQQLDRAPKYSLNRKRNVLTGISGLGSRCRIASSGIRIALRIPSAFRHLFVRRERLVARHQVGAFVRLKNDDRLNGRRAENAVDGLQDQPIRGDELIDIQFFLWSSRTVDLRLCGAVAGKGIGRVGDQKVSVGEG